MPAAWLLPLELHFGSARSLQDKRIFLRSVREELHRRNIASINVDHHDLLQRSSLPVEAVGPKQHMAPQSLSGAVAEIKREVAGVAISSQIKWHS
jgi:uncharacterized protein YlxP (DUF503 family)